MATDFLPTHNNTMMFTLNKHTHNTGIEKSLCVIHRQSNSIVYNQATPVKNPPQCSSLLILTVYYLRKFPLLFLVPRMSLMYRSTIYSFHAKQHNRLPTTALPTSINVTHLNND